MSHTRRHLNIDNASSTCRILVFFALLIWCIITSQAQTPAEQFASSGAVNPESCAVAIMDLKTEKIIDSHNIDMPLIPASINKVVTIATLLEKTGINYRYETDVYTTGHISDGILDGNLIIKGSGDPSLGADVDPKGTDILAECVKALKERDITIITGDIIIDETIFPAPAVPPSWQSGDLRHAYGTGCHGFNYKRNASGSASVSDPAAVFISQLRGTLQRNGIELQRLKDVNSGKKHLLFTHKSPTIDEIMRSCIMRSDNLYAEAMLRTLALASNHVGSTERGAELEMKYWNKKHLSTEGVVVVDGSGLSRSDRMTARFMMQVLHYMADNVDFASFFPLAGQEGTLRNFLKGTELDSYIALKTGSMNGIQCYAGYMLDDDYAPTHAIVIMANGFPSSRAAMKDAASKMLLDTFCSKSS